MHAASDMHLRQNLFIIGEVHFQVGATVTRQAIVAPTLCDVRRLGIPGHKMS